MSGQNKTVLGLLKDPVFLYFLRTVRPYKWMYIGAIVTQIAMTVVSLLFAEAGRRLFDLAPSVPGDVLTLILLAFTGLTVANLLLRFWNEWVRSLLNESVVYEMRRNILNHLQRLPLGFHENTHSSNSVNIMNNELEIVKQFLVSDIQKLIALPISFVIVGVYLLTVHPLLGMIALAIGPLQLLSSLVLRSKFMEAVKLQNEVTRNVFFQIGETLQGIREVKANQLEQQVDERMRAIQKQGVAYNVLLTKVRSIRSICKDIPGQAGYVIGLGIGAVMMATGHIGAGGLVAFITLLDKVAEPFTTVVEVINNLQRFLSGAHRLHEVMGASEEPMDAGLALTGKSPEITFRNVHFSYRNDVSALKDISFTVPPGASVALVGPSGAGKSTLVKLLYRFYEPDRGTIEMNGIPLQQYALQSLRGSMALVSQDIYLFDSSVADNIALNGQENVSPEQLERAASLAQAYDFIRELPDGFDTYVGERGVKLSHGQKQRISIARAILRGAPILILDEPTSALDVETEASFQRDLGEWAVDCTKIIIAHRLSTIREADLVIFIDGGQIVEMGPPEELLAVDGRFRSYWEKQGMIRFAKAVG
ncbi:ABC transporter ATP-binding protein [Paenibacillus allorhizosphaerae]|uniref:Multidrug export ATP-binding/permease protein n=1 Tax=Paenibacillus allorhizosphaerae TaxID=2849866 RepID=A0ABM8VP02_9BACL|nr:ABC transporter ATP-binding protein [Paenibacillus allorhizosphaerae]CAG7652271.1 Putative multidrug export ATP-binding/permease protein [Paenibacillus allorhizosphaerae]